MARRSMMARQHDESESALDWEREWREQVSDSIKSLTTAQQQTALLLERIMGRLDTLEQKPKEARAWAGIAGQGIYAVIAIASLIISLTSHLAWK